MATDDMEIASALRARLADKVGRQRYELWFGRGTSLQLQDAALVVGVASDFVRDWLRKHFRKDLEAVCQEVVGRALPIRFHVDPSLSQMVSDDSDNDDCDSGDCENDDGDNDDGDNSGNDSGGNDSDNRDTSHSAATEAPRVIQRDGSSRRGTAATRRGGAAAVDRPQSVGTRRNGQRHYADFASYVVGGSNKLAFTSAEIVAEQPGSLSPLLVHGGSGVGKTHLLEGIWSAMRQSDRGLHAIYLTAERFTTLFLEALGGRGLPSFRQKYRGVDLLLIDDVQFFSGKRATLVELLYTVDTLLKDNRQLVFASDRPPAELHALGPELVARLTGGLVCRVEQPDYAVRLGIVRNLSRQMGLEVPEDVLTLVASHITSSARELAGALKRLQVTSVAHQRPITRGLAEQALADLNDQTCRPVRLPDIQRAICDVFGIEPENLRSKRKVASVSHPRMLAMWLARKHTRAALSEIGHFFGRRSHSTVISAQKNVERWLRSQERLTLSQRTCEVEEAIRKVEETLRRA